MTFLSCYNIEGTTNLDNDMSFRDSNTYPTFQEDLIKFKSHIKQLVDDKECKTFYKFGDGDYHFLRGESIGSAKPGNRAISKSYSDINHTRFTEGAQLNDYYTCEIYPRNRFKFSEVIDKKIDYPAEYGYGLIANKWFFEQFRGRIGLLGASEKLYLIEELMTRDEYKEYLGLDNFNDYIHFPQKYACDDINKVEEFVGSQLKESNSDIFLVGIGHSKSGILHKFKEYTNSIFLDVGAGIDMISGCINNGRPYAGDWINYRLQDYDYSDIDYLNYNGQGEHKIL
tara:strand:+ start:1625 stop:2476 length:852 start_codon:yes stop_codon:yes gene_type:complete